MGDPVVDTITLNEGCEDQASLRIATWRPDSAGPELRSDGPAEIIMLHDGLGSISQWRSVPESVATRTGRTVMAYERPGHGGSTPVPTGPWPTDWLRDQAALLGQLITAIGAERPLLVGHSDGGSTALIHAASIGASQGEAGPRAVLALAAHSWVEQVCFDSILDMRANRMRIEAGLARHHQHPSELFEAWSGVWVSDAFRSWDIRPELSSIDVPVLVAQGADDAYASQAHAHLTAAAIGDNARSLIVDGVGHIMHHDDSDVVSALIADFVLLHL